MKKIIAGIVLAIAALCGMAAPALANTSAPQSAAQLCYNGGWSHGRYHLGGHWWNPHTGIWHYGWYYIYSFGGGVHNATSPPAGIHC